MLEEVYYVPADGAEIRRMKEVAESVTSSTALQNDNDLTFPVGANEKWQFEIHVKATFSTLGQTKVAITGPAGAIISADAHLFSDGISIVRQVINALATAVGLVGALATQGTIKIYGMMVTSSTEGDFTLQWAQNASSGTPTTFLAHSYLIAKKLS